MLKPQKQEGGNKHGINRSTEQKLQRGIHHIRWRKETAEVSEFFAHCFAMSLLIEPDLLNADPFKSVPQNHKQMFRTYFHNKLK